jgi:cobalt-zinc-cadmium resistance protein CzcA
MIRAIVDFALSHRLMMLAFGIFLFGMGIIQFEHLNIEAYPDTANNYAWIITQWPGQAAEEVER